MYEKPERELTTAFPLRALNIAKVDYSNSFTFASFFTQSENRPISPNLTLFSAKNCKKEQKMSAVYKNPTAGTPLISTISSGCKTPVLEVKFCNLVKPFYYPNSPKIARYSVTCVIDPIEHKDFLDSLLMIEQREGVETIIKHETEKQDKELVNTGRCLIKFQGKDQINIFSQKDPDQLEAMFLEDEFAKGEKIMIIYDILRYTKKNSFKTEHGLSFKPISIHHYPQEI